MTRYTNRQLNYYYYHYHYYYDDDDHHHHHYCYHHYYCYYDYCVIFIDSGAIQQSGDVTWLWDERLCDSECRQDLPAIVRPLSGLDPPAASEQIHARRLCRVHAGTLHCNARLIAKTRLFLAVIGVHRIYSTYGSIHSVAELRHVFDELFTHS